MPPYCARCHLDVALTAPSPWSHTLLFATQDFLVSCFIMRMPDSAVAKLAHDVGDWKDVHDRLVLKLLGHAAVELNPTWTNDTKAVRKQGPSTGRISTYALTLARVACEARASVSDALLRTLFHRTHAWCGFNADRSAFQFLGADRVAVATALGKEAATWDGVLQFPWTVGGGGTGVTAGKSTGKSKSMPPVIDFARLPDDPERPDVVSIGVHPFTDLSKVSHGSRAARRSAPCLALCSLPCTLRTA